MLALREAQPQDAAREVLVPDGVASRLLIHVSEPGLQPVDSEDGFGSAPLPLHRALSAAR